MSRIWNAIRKEAGQTLVEYGLILFLAAVVVVTALTAVGNRTGNAVQNIADVLP